MWILWVGFEDVDFCWLASDLQRGLDWIRFSLEIIGVRDGDQYTLPCRI